MNARLSRTAAAVARLSLSAALVVSASVAVLRSASAQPAPRPNIVLLVADDWAFSDLGAYGSEIRTPHLDALAVRGVRFSNFHVAASCAPSRAMMLTGLEHHRAGIGNLRETQPASHDTLPGYGRSLDPRAVTVSSRLQAAGYRTYISGKWNVGSEPHNLPNRRGFDRSIVQGDTGSDNWDPQQRYLPHSARVEWFEDGRPAAMPPQYYSSTYFVDRMLGFWREAAAGPAGASAQAPFFAVLGFQANHAPLQAPREFIERYRGRYDGGWDALRQQRRDAAAARGLVPAGAALAPQATTRPWSSLSVDEKADQARAMEVYAAMAEAMDHEVGRLVAHLKTTGDYDRTVFIFLSDNGPEGSDYREARPWLLTQYALGRERMGGPGAYAIMGPGWASAAAAPFSSFKFYAGEGGVRVPLVVAGVPGQAAGQVHHGLAHVTDLVPTLLELAQVPLPGVAQAESPLGPLVGRSLLPVLREPSRSLRGPDDTLGYELSGNSAFYRGGLKLVRNLPPVGDGQWHLHDLTRDPGETQDLQHDRPGDFQAMLAGYEAWAKTHGVQPMPDGYSPTRQVMINTFRHYWIPQYRWHGAAGLAVLAGLGLLWRSRRRRSSGSGSAG